MKTFTVEVTQTVEVTLDETKFDARFCADFDRYHYRFGDNLERHARHLGQLFARGIESEFSTFIEGYGIPQAMGIEFKDLDLETDVVSKGPSRSGEQL